MSQTSESNCGCNDYSLLTANNGIAFINKANPNLNGSGDIVPVLAAGETGTIIKSVRIKAIQATTPGMVRFFIGSAPGNEFSTDIDKFLLKEVRINTKPVVKPPFTAKSLIVNQMFEEIYFCDIKLAHGSVLYASTQNSESFNIIAEGYDIAYPTVTPSVCCNFQQNYPVSGMGSVSVSNPDLDGSGTIVPIIQADPASSGCLIESISIKALQTVNEGAIRIFISPDGTTYSLMSEIYVPNKSQSGFNPSFQRKLNWNFNLASGYYLGASTQYEQQFSIIVQGSSWLYPA